MARLQRLKRELKQIADSPPQGICIFPKDDKITKLEAQIIGPDDTPYSSGTFKLEIDIPTKYPFNPPSVKFITKVYHPNIDDNGRICMDLLKMPPNGTWKPTILLENLLVAVRMLLESPNPDDPLMIEVAKEFKAHREVFNDKAKRYTEKYATKTESTTL